MGQTADLNNITIVLNKPRYPENIGAAARVACNMGITKLAVVNPENYDVEKVMRLATHAAAQSCCGAHYISKWRQGDL